MVETDRFSSREELAFDYKALYEGGDAHRRGDPLSANKYPPYTPQFKAWRAGWCDSDMHTTEQTPRSEASPPLMPITFGDGKCTFYAASQVHAAIAQSEQTIRQQRESMSLVVAALDRAGVLKSGEGVDGAFHPAHRIDLMAQTIHEQAEQLAAYKAQIKMMNDDGGWRERVAELREENHRLGDHIASLTASGTEPPSP